MSFPFKKRGECKGVLLYNFDELYCGTQDKYFLSNVLQDRLDHFRKMFILCLIFFDLFRCGSNINGRIILPLAFCILGTSPSRAELASYSAAGIANSRSLLMYQPVALIRKHFACKRINSYQCSKTKILKSARMIVNGYQGFPKCS